MGSLDETYYGEPESEGGLHLMGWTPGGDPIRHERGTNRVFMMYENSDEYLSIGKFFTFIDLPEGSVIPIVFRDCL